MSHVVGGGEGTRAGGCRGVPSGAVADRVPRRLLVLDEMDQLGSRAQDVLYTIFEWPRLPGSRLVLIGEHAFPAPINRGPRAPKPEPPALLTLLCTPGLANALDLTERLLARLHTPPLPAPHLLRFAPYGREQLTAILHGRLEQLQGGPVLEPSALQFCARKVSAVSGDARKALDVCRWVWGCGALSDPRRSVMLGRCQPCCTALFALPNAFCYGASPLLPALSVGMRGARSCVTCWGQRGVVVWSGGSEPTFGC